MDFIFLLKGLILGFSIAAPVGPIGILCIRRTLAQGLPSGFVSGLGAATADGIYGCIAGFGLTVISNFLVAQQTWLHFLGGLFLLYLGFTTFYACPADKEAAMQDGSPWGSYFSTLFLTLTNPLTILSFTAIFAGLGLGATNIHSAGWLVLGVFLGSAFWWLILSTMISLLSHNFNQQSLKWVNRFAGLIIATFGLLALITI